MVVGLVFERLGHALHVGQLVVRVVRILIAVAVTQILHEFGRRVADDKWNGLRKHGQCVLFGALVCDVKRVRFGRERHIDDRLGQMHAALGHAYQMARLICRDRDLERARVGKPYVLARKAGHSPCDIDRVFARFEHSRQPIDRRVGIGIAHRLVQRRDEVVVFLAVFVIEQRLL